MYMYIYILSASVPSHPSVLLCYHVPQVPDLEITCKSSIEISMCIYESLRNSLTCTLAAQAGTCVYITYERYHKWHIYSAVSKLVMVNHCCRELKHFGACSWQQNQEVSIFFPSPLETLVHDLFIDYFCCRQLGKIFLQLGEKPSQIELEKVMNIRCSLYRNLYTRIVRIFVCAVKANVFP